MPVPKNEDNPYSIVSIEKSFAVLEYIIRSTHDISAIEIHSQTGIPKATLHKILQTLIQLGYIEQNPKTNLYFPTLKMLQVSYHSVNRHGFFDAYYPYLLMFMRRFACPASLAAYSGYDPVVVYSSVGASDFVVDQRRHIGCTLPLYASSSGRLLLAELDEATCTGLLSETPLVPLTGRTLCTTAEILASLEDVRRRGYCRIDGEIYYGFSNLSFPLRDTEDRLIGSMNFVLPTESADAIITPQAAEEVLRCMDKARLNIV